MTSVKSKYQQFIYALLFGIVCSCSVQNSTTKHTANIIQLADPTIFLDKGTYYLYGTGGSKNTNGFAVYTSRNLKKWKQLVRNDGYAFKKGNGYGNENFWAPQVFRHNNKFYMAYTANEHIAIAESDNPLGPFKQKESRALIENLKQIDPFIFIDEDGKRYLYYVIVANGGNRIFVGELNADMRTVKSETGKLCLEATERWENTSGEGWSVLEGPTVLKHNGLYYMIYSANHFRSSDYAVGYAVSRFPFGPWKKYEGNPIIHKSITGHNGSGHGDVLIGKDKELLYVFHTHHSADNIGPRKTAIIKLKFIRDDKSGIDKLAVDPKSFSYLYAR